MKDIGREHFTISLLDDTATNLDELLERERYYIKKYNSIKNGYNTTTQKTSGRISNRRPFITYLEDGIYKELKTYSEETSIPISKILDRSVEMYLKSVKNKK